jgi:hypothetical protein
MPTTNQGVKLANRRVLRASLFMAIQCWALNQPGAADPAHSEYTQEMYTKALSNNSTGPSYLLVMVRSAETTTEGRVTCMVAPSLRWAIDREYGLSHSKSDGEKREKIALGSTDRSFTFKNPEVYKMIQPQYTPKILDEARRLVGSKSKDQLIHELTSKDPIKGEGIHAFYRPKAKLFGAYRDALAHALLERGLLVDRGDLGGGLYLHKDWPLHHL